MISKLYGKSVFNRTEEIRAWQKKSDLASEKVRQDRRREMVCAVRRGQSLRLVSREFGVSLNTVRHWVERAQSDRLDRVDWSSHSPGAKRAVNRSSDEVERLVLQLREELKHSDLGEWGADAILHEWKERDLLANQTAPSPRTIHRILERHGVLDSRRRQRPPAPTGGWYLPDVAAGQAELDQFDVVNGLTIRGGPEVQVFTAVSQHGGWVDAWPQVSVTSATVREAITERWRQWGLPAYAQFDNDTRFQGAHRFPDIISSVMRFCLSLGVTPVFALPRETGFQAAIEVFNGRWQAKVWARYEHESLAALQNQSRRYIVAAHHKGRQRAESAPLRGGFPIQWQLDLQQPPTVYASGCIIFLRRTDDSGAVRLLERRFEVDANWPHRLIRAEVHLPLNCIRFYRLRRRDPEDQPLLREIPYIHPPRKRRFHHLENK